MLLIACVRSGWASSGSSGATIIVLRRLLLATGWGQVLETAKCRIVEAHAELPTNKESW